VGHDEQICGELMVTFRTIKSTDQSFFVIQCMYMYLLCITNLVTSNKKTLICFSMWLPRKKISQIRSQSKWDTMNKYMVSCFFLFVQFFKIY